MNDTPRVIPWGTITCGFLAASTAVLVGLVQVGGVAIPFRTLGPGAIVGVGVIILLAGLVIMMRANAKELRARATAPVPPLARTSEPLDELGPPQPSEPTTENVTTVTPTTEIPTTETPAAQGAAEGPSEQGRGEAQSSH